MFNRIANRKITLVLFIITALSVVSASFISYWQSHSSANELVSDFEQSGFEELKKSDFGEDGDSIILPLPQFDNYIFPSASTGNCSFNFDHIIQEISSPPPELT